MKIITLSSCLILILTAVLFNSNYSLHVNNLNNKLKTETDPGLKYNQIFTYPNTYEAPTMSVQLPLANFTAPFLSRALFEEDPQRKLRSKDFMNTIRFSMYQLTRGETEQIFVFADRNHDDLLDQSEWDAFTALFVFPFEACDKNGDYILSEEEFKECWDADPKTKFVTFRRRNSDNKYKQLMEIVQTRGKNAINFSDYLFIRRSLFGWKECHSNWKYIAISSFKCALRTAVPNKYHLKLDHETIYAAGLKLSNDPSLIELDYISYLRVLYFSYVFAIFGQPNDIPWMDKTQFIKAVREDRFPTNFEESEINILYDLTNINPFQKNIQMSFSSWCFFFNLHRLFNKYSIEKPLQLNETEVISLLSDPLSPYGVTLSVDLSKTNFTESQYLEVSMVLQRLRLNERDFYYSFKAVAGAGQDASVATASVNDPKTINSTFYDFSANNTNRHFLFTTMSGIDKRFWTKEIYYRTFVFANLYTEMCTDKRWLVSTSTFIEKMESLYATTYPPIGMKYRKNYYLYKSLPKDIYIDILTFLALENYQFKFYMHKLSSNSNELINETMLKIILNDYGMINMPDTVIDLAKKGYDTLRRRVYVPREVIKYLIIVHSAAGENVRNTEYLNDFHLKINSDFSRKFLNFPRRFKSSPLV